MKRLFLCFVALFGLFLQVAYAQDPSALDALRSEGFDIVNIENDGVRRYLDDTSYDNPTTLAKYNISCVANYARGFGSRPSGYRVSWTNRVPPEMIDDVVIKVCEDEKFKHGVRTYYPDSDSTSYVICNMKPGAKYYYRVVEVRKDGARKIIHKGKFFTTGRVRMLRVDGMYNVRDFGGWPTSNGKKTRFGRVFRGNRPEGITSIGKHDFVRNERITADLDLRGTNLGVSPLGPIDKVEYYVTSNQRYKLALTSSTRALATDLHVIADVLSRGGSVFIHCNHGVNRCGTLSFLLGGIIGLSEADLCRDYELSAFAYRGVCRTGSYASMLDVIRLHGDAGDNLTECFHNYCRSIGVSDEDLKVICREMQTSRD